jgi:hypothetical protein
MMELDETPLMNERGFFAARAETTYCLGLDIGQVNDNSAISVVARVRTPIAPEEDGINQMTLQQRLTEPRYDVLHLERLKLGMSYPDQVEYVAGLLSREPLRSSRAKFALDKTGIGRAIFDLFVKRRLHPIGISITGGSGESQDDFGGYKVSKINLIGRLQTAFHTGSLRIAPKLKQGPVLANELRSFAATVSENSGNLSYGARSGQHDDLLLSLAIAIWVLHGPSGHGYSVQEFIL